MGDGGLAYTRGQVPCVETMMTNPKYVYGLWELFGALSTDHITYRTAQEVKNRRQKGGAVPPSAGAKPQYRWRTRKCPELMLLEPWYCSGGKVFPKGTSLTPATLKHWYSGDGGVNIHHGKCVITSVNEMDDFSNILSMFNDIGFSPNTSGTHIYFTKEESHELLDYMGDPPPGFEHKWILDDRERYERQREIDYQPPEALSR
jgi:hypothetical protein